MTAFYSTAICPPEHILNPVDKMKQELYRKTKWYHSINSLAHITVNEFFANDKELISRKAFIQNFCTPIDPFEVLLDKTGHYTNGAFYLYPDHNSKHILASLMKRFHRENPFSAKMRSSDPHMSIGRKLSSEVMEIAIQLWGDQIFDLRFICDNIALRKLNEKKQQFDIIQRFPFMNARSHLLF